MAVAVPSYTLQSPRPGRGHRAVPQLGQQRYPGESWCEGAKKGGQTSGASEPQVHACASSPRHFPPLPAPYIYAKGERRRDTRRSTPASAVERDLRGSLAAVLDFSGFHRRSSWRSNVCRSSSAAREVDDTAVPLSSPRTINFAQAEAEAKLNVNNTHCHSQVPHRQVYSKRRRKRDAPPFPLASLGGGWGRMVNLQHTALRENGEPLLFSFFSPSSPFVHNRCAVGLAYEVIVWLLSLGKCA
jgi:hypothetical protein